MVYSDAHSWILDSCFQWSPSSLTTFEDPAFVEDNHCCLNPTEIWWRDQQEWLRDCGYMLRQRYHPGWIPSWKGSTSDPKFFEDALAFPEDSRTMDAIRTSDGIPVGLRVIDERQHPNEADVALFLSSDRLASDIRNHCAPVFEVLEIPDQASLSIIVMPLLRPCYDPDMKTVGEATELLRQIFEGFEFMHENNVAHLNPDIRYVAYDAREMLPYMYHPIATHMSNDLTKKATHYTRTECPPKYYFIDFSISRRFQSNLALHSVVRWKNNFAPEYKRPEEPCNPFALDVYLLGDRIRAHFLTKYKGFGWLKPLVDDMCQEDPSSRPTMVQVMTRYEWMITSFPYWKLASRLVQRDENVAIKMLRSYKHIAKRKKFRVARLAPVPPEFFNLSIFNFLQGEHRD